jgi:uncharacterized protein (DUF1778 family)
LTIEDFGAILRLMNRTEQMQIRVTPKEKAALKRLARRSGQGVSAYVLSRALPENQLRFAELLQALQDEGERRFALAEMNDLLACLTGSELRESVTEAPDEALSPYLRNYVAAMVEQAAQQKGIAPPSWVGSIDPLPEPHFAAPLQSLRPHLLRASPVAFRKRNLFVDSGIGDRV